MNEQIPETWYACDGHGGDRATTTRRALLGGAVSAAVAAWAGKRSALAQIAVGPHDEAGDARDVLITLFLRGGMDGLSLVVPHGDDDYYRARPTLGLAVPKDKRQGVNAAVADLDGFFGLHPALAASLHPLYAEGNLAVVHAVGSQDRTRSHFEAMATVERGQPDEKSFAASGWIARYLNAQPALSSSPLRAIAWGHLMPDALRGATDVSVLSSLADFRLKAGKDEDEARFGQALDALYRRGADAVAASGRETLAVIDALKRVDPEHYTPANGAAYPKSELGDGLRQVACLIKAGIGLEVACLDRGGWDTHVAQGGATGYFALQARDVGDSLAAFARDLGKDGLRRVTLVAFTEFGRRVGENSGLGTDHGRASALFVLGGNVNGGKVYARWPGLAPAKLEAPGDLPVTTDYRAVFAEIVGARLRSPLAPDHLFPGLDMRRREAAPLNLVRPIV